MLSLSISLSIHHSSPYFTFYWHVPSYSFLCTFAKPRNALLTVHSLMTPIHVSASAQSLSLQKGLLRHQARASTPPRWPWSTVHGMHRYHCSTYACLCSFCVILSFSYPESFSKRRVSSNSSLYFQCLEMKAQ